MSNIDVTSYLFFRLLVIPDNQMNLLLANTTKEEFINGILLDLSKSKKTDVYLSEYRRYIIYPLASESEEVLRFALAKPVRKTLEQEGDDNIELIEFSGLESINFIYYKKRQIILFEKNKSVFGTIDFPAKILTEYLQEKASSYNISIAITAIPSSIRINEHINAADKLYAVELNINQLNIGEGNKPLRELLSTIKQQTNEDHLKLKLTNVNGNLNAKNGFIHNAIDYIGQVGGSIVLLYSTIRNKRKKKFDSKEAIKVTDLKKEVSENTDEEIINNIKEISPENSDNEENI